MASGGRFPILLWEAVASRQRRVVNSRTIRLVTYVPINLASSHGWRCVAPCCTVSIFGNYHASVANVLTSVRSGSNEVLVLSSNGVARLQQQEWTLHEKAAYYASIIPRHDR